MIIINKDKTSFVNYEQIENVFIGDTSIKANLKSGKGMQLAKYNTNIETQMAFEILIDKIGNNVYKIQMPLDEEVAQKINSMPVYKTRHISGKKTKGHGGS